MQTCTGKTRTGATCRAPAGASGLCFFHANPDSARALGQLGGRRNRRRAILDLQVPDNMTATDLRNLTGQAIRLLLSGDLRPREASALAQLCNSLYRTIPTAALETRVANLERRVAQEGIETLRNRDAPRSPRDGALAGKGDAHPAEEQQTTGQTDDLPAGCTQSEDGTEHKSDASSEAESA
jgi:hypothetical protein